MEQDCTVSQSAADETKCFHSTENNEFPKGNHVSEPGGMTGSVVEKYNKPTTPISDEKVENQLSVSATQTKDNPLETGNDDKKEKYEPVSWCYLFVHHQKVKAFEEQLKADTLTYFVHKTIKYVPRHRNKSGVHEVEKPTVSGLIFIQGNSKKTQKYLNEKMPPHKLCKNCSTGKVATIPCSQMEPFMRIAETEPERLRFLLRPFVYYSKNRTLLRIVTGDYAGLEGYVIRIARDRKLVMDVGGMAVAISGIHAERFEEVHKNEADKQERETFYKRNLQERNAFIDRYFHQVRNIQEIEEQVENIDILRLQTLADVRDRKLDLKDAFNTFCFMVEEISYYYSPFIDRFKEDLTPIFEAGKKVMTEIKYAINKFKRGTNKELSQRCETEYEELTTLYGYLFD